MGEETSVCPSCGMPQRHGPGIIGTRMYCRYCGSALTQQGTFKVAAQPCENHPEAPSVGSCKECGGGFCEYCLYVLPRSERGYVCEKCLGEVIHRIRTNNVLRGLVVTAFLVSIPLSYAQSFAQYPFAFLMMLLVMAFPGIGSLFEPVEFYSLASKMHEFASSPGSVIVTCGNCGAVYHYAPDKIDSDNEVVCQNCNRIINMQGAPGQASY